MTETNEPKIIRADKRAGRGRTLVVVLAALAALLTGSGAATFVPSAGAVERTDQRAEKLPDSFQCLAGALAQAPILFTVAAAPPPGLWTITLAGISSAIGLVQVVDACRDWITTPLGQVVIQGPCENDAHCRGDGVTQRTFGYYAGGGGGGGGGGSW